MKKLILAVMLCCTLSAVSNAVWLPAFFLRFINAAGPACYSFCQSCIRSGNPCSGECLGARGQCDAEECSAAYECREL